MCNGIYSCAEAIPLSLHPREFVIGTSDGFMRVPIGYLIASARGEKWRWLRGRIVELHAAIDCSKGLIDLQSRVI